MKSPRLILVPLDDSPSAQAALALALQLAKAAGSEVVLVHASPEIAAAVFEANPLSRDETEEIAADPVLRDGVAQATSAGVTARARLIGESGADAVADAVLGIASSVDADLVVMGSRGRGPIAESLLGSISRGVASRASIPVVVVNQPPEE